MKTEQVPSVIVSSTQLGPLLHQGRSSFVCLNMENSHQALACMLSQLTFPFQSCGSVFMQKPLLQHYWVMNLHTSKSDQKCVHIHLTSSKKKNTLYIIHSQRVLHAQNLACSHCTSQELTAFLMLITSPHLSCFSLLFHAVGYGSKESFCVPSV